MINENANERTRTSQPDWFTFLRIALGILIIWKGINLIRNIALAQSLIEQTEVGVFFQNSSLLAYVITYLSLLCGLFILIGFRTRLSSMVLIPVLLVAVFLINIKRVEDNIFEFILSLTALALLILFSIKRSDRLSADEYFRSGAALDRRQKEHFV